MNHRPDCIDDVMIRCVCSAWKHLLFASDRRRVIPESGLLSAVGQIDGGSDSVFSGMKRSNTLLSWDQQSAGPTWGSRKWPQRLAPVHSAVQAGLKGHMAKPSSPESCSIRPSVRPSSLHRRPMDSSQIYEPPPSLPSWTGTSPPAATRTPCLSVWFRVPGSSISPKIPDGIVPSEGGCRENLSCCFTSHSAASLSCLSSSRRDFTATRCPDNMSDGTQTSNRWLCSSEN